MPKHFGYGRSMKDGPGVAEVAALIGDPARANILAELANGRALTATELSFVAGVSPQTTSEHLTKLARYVDRKMGELVGAMGQVGDARLLVMASLLITDELSDAYQQLESFGAESQNEGWESAEETMAAALESCAERIDNMLCKHDRLEAYPTGRLNGRMDNGMLVPCRS